jgi:hypothetical protein
MRIFPLALLLWAAGAYSSAPIHEKYWFAVLMDGAKVGYAVNQTEQKGEVITTTQRLHIATERLGTPIEMITSGVTTETIDGRPLGFVLSEDSSGQKVLTEGFIEDGSIKLKKTVAGLSTERIIPYPKGALMLYGYGKAVEQAGLEPGRTRTFLMFEPSIQEAIEVEVEISAARTVELSDREMRLFGMRETMRLPGLELVTEHDIDEDFVPWRSRVNILGAAMSFVRCEESCAKAPNQSWEAFDDLMVPAPKFNARRTKRDALYTLRSKDGRSLEIANSSEQSARVEGAHTLVRVDADTPRRVKLSKHQRALWTLPNEWLQSQAPELRALLPKRLSKDQSKAMAQLRDVVDAHISDKNLAVGYASALETVRDRAGDCTEHALLLAALGRAAGIPTRVVNGFAFAEYYQGKRKVFVPHAWTQAYVDGAWRSFDAALGTFNAGHLAVSVGNGDPARYFGTLNFLGNLEIISIKPVAESSL